MESRARITPYDSMPAVRPLFPRAGGGSIAGFPMSAGGYKLKRRGQRRLAGPLELADLERLEAKLSAAAVGDVWLARRSRRRRVRGQQGPDGPEAHRHPARPKSTASTPRSSSGGRRSSPGDLKLPARRRLDAVELEGELCRPHSVGREPPPVRVSRISPRSCSLTIREHVRSSVSRTGVARAPRFLPPTSGAPRSLPTAQRASSGASHLWRPYPRRQRGAFGEPHGSPSKHEKWA